jgi:hypothetical protein
MPRSGEERDGPSHGVRGEGRRPVGGGDEFLEIVEHRQVMAEVVRLRHGAAQAAGNWPARHGRTFSLPGPACACTQALTADAGRSAPR